MPHDIVHLQILRNIFSAFLFSYVHWNHTHTHNGLGQASVYRPWGVNLTYVSLTHFSFRSPLNDPDAALTSSHSQLSFRITRYRIVRCKVTYPFIHVLHHIQLPMMYIHAMPMCIYTNPYYCSRVNTDHYLFFNQITKIMVRVCVSVNCLHVYFICIIRNVFITIQGLNYFRSVSVCVSYVRKCVNDVTRCGSFKQNAYIVRIFFAYGITSLNFTS